MRWRWWDGENESAQRSAAAVAGVKGSAAAAAGDAWLWPDSSTASMDGSAPHRVHVW